MRESEPVIALTTDFGYRDPFVGVMKGVILRINPSAKIVDLNHGITPQNISEASYSLGVSYKFFPDRTIHVVVVDPGVGSGRRPLMVGADNQYFIGPDNGVFSYVYALSQRTPRVVHVTAERYFLSAESPTFQGRDLFAPVAGWLSRGVPMSEFGDPISDYRRFDVPSPNIAEEGVLRGEVIHIDRFGNVITNVRAGDMERLRGKSSPLMIEVIIGDREVPLREFYSQAGDRALYCLVNSSGYLELFVNGGNASATYNISAGDKVEIRVVSDNER